MSEKLTDKEWQEMRPPFHWMRINRKDWSDINFEIIEKTLYSDASGWWHHAKESGDRHLFVFELQADMVRFKIWLTTDPFNKEFGEF